MNHLFIMPTLDCSSHCTYCFIPKLNSPVMDIPTLEKTLGIFGKLPDNKTHDQSPIITFHGGEPLLAGIDFYKKALPLIRKKSGNTIKIGIQTNLWHLDDEFCLLFKEYGISIGTSLDGPREINDVQRSGGYFDKTMAGISLLRKHGLSAACIATFTGKSAKRVEEIFQFFLEKGLHFDIHPAVKPFHFTGDAGLFLSPSEYGDLLIRLLNLYIENIDRIKIGTLDTLIRNVSQDESGLCLFSRCIGKYLAVTPTGELYPCNRFAGNPEYCIGNVDDIICADDIYQTDAWKKLEGWNKAIDDQCKECLHKNICHGGCPYAGLSANNGKPVKDPYCQSYQIVYHYILEKGTDEFFSDENLETFTHNSGKKTPTTSVPKNILLHIMRDEPHPYDSRKTAKIILLSAFIGHGIRDEEIADWFVTHQLAPEKNRVLSSLTALRYKIKNPPDAFNNLYIHITGKCNLNCDHCYYIAGNKNNGEELPVDKIVDIIRQGSFLRFRKIVITGGEPLVHSGIDRLMKTIGELESDIALPPVVLRTNLSMLIPEATRKLMTQTFSEIVASLDGSEKSHDKRRGRGCYQRVIANLADFDPKILSDKISLACVIDHTCSDRDSIEEEKSTILKTAANLGISQVRFTPILPLGKAKAIKALCGQSENMTVYDWHKNNRFPSATCGLGFVLMIGADGNVYPCHVFSDTDHLLGNIFKESLMEITGEESFQRLRHTSVDTDEKCSSCNMRYFCHGRCKVWAETDCRDVYERIRFLVEDALELLGVENKSFGDIIEKRL